MSLWSDILSCHKEKTKVEELKNVTAAMLLRFYKLTVHDNYPVTPATNLKLNGCSEDTIACFI